MANTTTSANMLLPIPVVGVDPGPDWATNLNNCLTIIDAHNHAPGSGTQVGSDGLNIASDLTINNNNLTHSKSIRFQSQSAPLAGASDLGCLYESIDDLYFNDGAGNQVRITQNGGIAGTPGSISNLVSPASAAYSAGSATFIWQSDVNTAANMDNGSVTIREVLANANGITLSSPTSLAANYTLTLPAALPASTKILQVTSAGAIADVLDVDNSSINISSNLIQIKDGGVTKPKLAALGQQISSSCGSFSTTSGSYVDITNLSVTITTIGRPVYIGLIGDGTTGSSNFSAGSVTAGASLSYQLLINGTGILVSTLTGNFGGATSTTLVYPCSVFYYIDVPAAGTWTYKLQMKSNGGTGGLTNAKLIAYEI